MIPIKTYNIFSVIFFLLIYLPKPFGGWSYFEGRYNSNGLIFLFLPIYSILYLIFIGISITKLQQYRKQINKLKPKISFRLILPIFIVLSPLIFFLSKPAYQTYTIGFRDYIKNEIEVDPIRNWLKEIDTSNCFSKEYDLREHNFKWPKEIDWPKSLTNLQPHYIMLRKDDNNNIELLLTWGGGFGHWGVNFHTTDDKIDINKRYAYGVPITSQVIAWHEVQ